MTARPRANAVTKVWLTLLSTNVTSAKSLSPRVGCAGALQFVDMNTRAAADANNFRRGGLRQNRNTAVASEVAHPPWRCRSGCEAPLSARQAAAAFPPGR